MQVTYLDYLVHDTTMQSVLVYDDSITKKRPGLIMAPDWWGINDNQIEIAKQIAAQDYIVLIADIYGQTIRPKNTDESLAAILTFKDNRPLLRDRMKGAFEQLKMQVTKSPLDQTRLGAFGFCFGGKAVLDLARTGAELAGVATFHGSLETDDNTLAQNIKAKILVMNGADDELVSHEEIHQFEDEMRRAKVDWQFINYGNAVHCFAIPTADGSMNPNCLYDKKTHQRSLAHMQLFFTELFE